MRRPGPVMCFALLNPNENESSFPEYLYLGIDDKVDYLSEYCPFLQVECIILSLLLLTVFNILFGSPLVLLECQPISVTLLLSILSINLGNFLIVFEDCGGCDRCTLFVVFCWQ